MKIHTTNYYDTFIEVAEDCPCYAGELPPLKGDELTVARQQYEWISQHPYEFTSDDILFHLHATRNQLIETELEESKTTFFSKGQACFRASPLPKRYGWGIHYNSEGKIALYGRESAEYQSFCENPNLKIFKAMRNKKQT